MDIGNERIKELLIENNIPFGMTRKSLIVDCPDCGREQKTYIRKSNGQTICFVCNKRWGWRGIVAALFHISIPEAENLVIGHNIDLSEKLTIELKGRDELADETFEDEDKEPLKRVFLDFGFVHVERSERGAEYMFKRGATDPNAWVRFDVRYNALMDGVVFPVYSDGVCVGYQTRFINPKQGQAKAQTMPGMPTARVMLNYDNARKLKNLIVVEGPFDCIKTDLVAPDTASVSTFGKRMSADHIRMVAESSAENVYLGQDPDAWKDLQPYWMELAKKKNVFRIFPPNGRKDFGECSTEEIKQALGDAQRCFEDHLGRLEVFYEH